MTENSKSQGSFPGNVLVVDCETTSADPHSCKLLGTVLYDGNESPVWVSGAPKDEELKGKYLVMQNGKFDSVVLARHGVSLPLCRVGFDTMIAQYLLAIDKPRKLEAMVKLYFGEDKEDLVQVYNRVTGKNRVNLPNTFHEEIPEQELIKYAFEDAISEYRLFMLLKEKLKETKLHVWFEIEMIVLNILIQTEVRGIKLDTEGLESLGKDLVLESRMLEDKIRSVSGKPGLNIQSSPQLQDLLYNKLKLPKLTKTKTGYSTDSATLRKISNRHAVCGYILQYRERQKLLSTYVLGLKEKTDPNGFVHTQYNQALTRTRRFSSENPNLQNIPARSPLGRRIKECFVPTEGNSFVVADFSQMELRILAHASQDEKLLHAYKTDQDIHKMTSDALGIDRRQAKIVNFAIIYGVSEFGLSDQVNLTIPQSKDLISKFLVTYPGIQRYMARQKALVIRDKGFVYTIPGGLYIHCGDVSTNDKYELEEIFRRAINAPIQGGSQDILKMAIVNVYEQFRLIPSLMVHDELVYEVPTKEALDLEQKIKGEMETAWELSVPMKVETKVTTKWGK